MSAEPDFDQIYRLLGVQPDQGWEAVRDAYRQRAQALHPDKVSGDPKLLRQARQRFEQLNQAYRELRRYRKIFGALPPVGMARASPVAKANRKRPAPAPAKRRRSRKLLGLGALVLVAATIAWFVLGPAPLDWDLLWNGSDAAEPAAQATPPARIVIGASLGQVLDIQGQPDRVDGDVWFYGDSTIAFENGRVTDWDAAADRPLRTATLKPESGPPARFEPPVRESFRVGSTKTEVARIQGQPLRATDSEWDYGVSKVYFKNDRVASWYNSPVDPLKVPGPYHHD